MEAYEITVTGKVQKVWFRKYTQEKAISLQLTGYVMNLSNGSVYIQVYGEKTAIANLTNWLKTKGSPLSVVKQVDIQKIKYDASYTSFEIKR